MACVGIPTPRPWTEDVTRSAGSPTHSLVRLSLAVLVGLAACDDHSSPGADQRSTSMEITATESTTTEPATTEITVTEWTTTEPATTEPATIEGPDASDALVTSGLPFHLPDGFELLYEPTRYEGVHPGSTVSSAVLRNAAAAELVAITVLRGLPSTELDAWRARTAAVQGLGTKADELAAREELVPRAGGGHYRELSWRPATVDNALVYVVDNTRGHEADLGVFVDAFHSELLDQTVRLP